MKTLGSEGEDLAIRFLKNKGYRIIARNYKTPIGEVDIIAGDGNITVFIEVKTRKDDSFGYPFEAVTQAKQKKIKNIALLYLKKQGKESPVRFDVISIFYTGPGSNRIEHILDAFED
jgi:putative endonuclease